MVRCGRARSPGYAHRRPVDIAAMSDGDYTDESFLVNQLVDDSVGAAASRPPTLMLQRETLAEPLGVLRDHIQRLEHCRSDRDRQPIELAACRRHYDEPPLRARRALLLRPAQASMCQPSIGVLRCNLLLDSCVLGRQPRRLHRRLHRRLRHVWRDHLPARVLPDRARRVANDLRPTAVAPPGRPHHLLHRIRDSHQQDRSLPSFFDHRDRVPRVLADTSGGSSGKELAHLRVPHRTRRPRHPSAADRPIEQREQLGEVPLGRRLVVGGGVAHCVAVGGPLVEL